MQDIETRLELHQMNTDVESRKKAKRKGESQGDLLARGNLTGHKQLAPQARSAKKIEFARNSGTSTSRKCSQLKR